MEEFYRKLGPDVHGEYVIVFRRFIDNIPTLMNANQLLTFHNSTAWCPAYFDDKSIKEKHTWFQKHREESMVDLALVPK